LAFNWSTNTLKPDSDGPSKAFIQPDCATAAPITMSSAQADVDRPAPTAKTAAVVSNDFTKAEVFI